MYFVHEINKQQTKYIYFLTSIFFCYLFSLLYCPLLSLLAQQYKQCILDFILKATSH